MSAVTAGNAPLSTTAVRHGVRGIRAPRARSASFAASRPVRQYGAQVEQEVRLDGRIRPCEEITYGESGGTVPLPGHGHPYAEAVPGNPQILSSGVLADRLQDHHALHAVVGHREGPFSPREVRQQHIQNCLLLDAQGVLGESERQVRVPR